MAQSVERRLGKAEVTGSIPVISFGIFIFIKKTGVFSGTEALCWRSEKTSAFLFYLIFVRT